MKSTKPACGYCGEPSKWGYYNIDGMKICDECGDFVRNLDPRPRIKPVIGTCGKDEHPKHLTVEPILFGKVHHPRNDLSMIRARCQGDVVINIVRVKNEIVATDLIHAHPRFHSLLEVFRKLFAVCHIWWGGKVLKSQTNVKEHAPALTPHAETGGEG